MTLKKALKGTDYGNAPQPAPDEKRPSVNKGTQLDLRGSEPNLAASFQPYGPGEDAVSFRLTPVRSRARACHAVIYDCTLDETSETLAEALDSENVQMARPMGKSGSVLITFASSRPPRYVKYWDFLKNFIPYEPRSVVCFRCHGFGHKQDVCPAENAVCPLCGSQHEEAPESCPQMDKKYCCNCEKEGHLASCPQRMLFAKHAKAAQGHQSRSAIQTGKNVNSSSQSKDLSKGRSRSRKQQKTCSKSRPSSKPPDSGAHLSTSQPSPVSYASITSRAQNTSKKTSRFSPRYGEEIAKELKQIDMVTEVSTRDFQNTLSRLQKQL
ncbi:hypothetical protein HPB49_006718 [Dermacentor silvarum]|uniref:Uncharacterized protein n=1 Tax=Dermacentor silvarum TaxID=543639 RepID=A0ACB8DI55_DERSI|nr:hypothetical protein HPB49_006718 [Dermacentor silvarum]